MQAKITNESGFKIAIGGTTVVTYKHGEIVSGHVAQRAIETGNAIEAKQTELNYKAKPKKRSKKR